MKTNIVFDEELAIQQKNTIDQNVPIENRQVRRGNTILVIILILAACLFFGIISWGIMAKIEDLPREIAILSCALIAGILTFSAISIYWTYAGVIRSEEGQYPTNVKYFLATKNQNILESKYCEKHLKLTLEDQDHVVTVKEIYLGSFETKIKTDISETIIDFNEGAIYKPYFTKPQNQANPPENVMPED